MWRRKRLKACAVFNVDRELGHKKFLVGSRKSFLKRITSISLVIVALAGTVFLVHNIFDVNAAAPIVNTIEPDNGPIAGGTKITITGSGFLGQYEQVEYIHLDGNSYIQTDVTQLNRNLSVRIMPDAYDSARFVVGAANTSGTQIFAIQRAGGNQYTFYTGATTVGTGGPTSSTVTTIPATGMVDIAFDWVRQAHINGSQYPSETTFIGSAVPTVASYYQIGGTNSYSGYFKGRFYQMKLTGASNGNLESHIVPVREKSTNNYGVVDLVTGKFYGNAGVGTITGGAVVPGSLAPDRPISVTIDGRACTGIEIISDTELTCHTPSGLSLGQKDVIVSNSIIPSETTTITDGYEYALRLNAVLPKFGDPDVATDIEIEGGVFSTPPDSYVSASVSGIKFDGSSWIAPGFTQIGSTRYEIDFKLPSANAAYNTGFIGSRSTGSTGSFLMWQLAAGNFRSDYGSSGGVSTSYAAMRDVRASATIDDGWTLINGTRTADRAKLNFSTLLPAEMLLGSITTGSGYGTNGFSNYLNYGGIIYSAQICKERSIAESMGVIYQESSICDPPSAYNATTNPTGTSYSYTERNNRVLVRDLQAAIRTSDNVCGFYDMVTGEFLTNAGYGTLTCTKDTTDNILEVPVELEVIFTYDDENSAKQTGICANPELLSTTKLKCTMPVSPLPNDGQGKVDLTVYANDVEATSGTADANDYYYGSPMVVETISPNRGSTAGGQAVTITGNNFQPSLNSVPTFNPVTDWAGIEVTIGGSPCLFNVSGGVLVDPGDYTNTSITCTTTSNAGGISDIEASLTYYDEIDQEIKNTYYLYGGALDPISGAITSGYLYEDDLISISPNIGPTTGGTVVTITGNGFLQGVGITTQVFFGNVAASSATITVISSTEIRVTTPRSATTGIKNVTVVQTGYAASFTRNLENGFEYEFVTGTGTLTPNQAYTTGGDTVLLTGTFDSQAPTTIVTLTSGIAPNQVITTLDPQSINILSDTQIEILMPAHSAGVVLVSVNQHSTDIPIANLTYVNPLTINSITPNVGPVAGGTTVVITGASFIPIGSNATNSFSNLSVTIGGVACAVASVSAYTNTSITCTTGQNLVSGLYDVVVAVDTDNNPLTPINPNHTDTTVNGYRYVELGISISSQTIDLGTISPTAPTGINSALVYVQTNNPGGYSVSIRADDSNATTTNDNWLKCTTNQSYKFESLTIPGSLTNNTWGWNVDDTTPLSAPTTFNPIVATNASFVNSPNMTPNSGTEPDNYRLWFSAKTAPTQVPCAYRATVLLTAVASS